MNGGDGRIISPIRKWLTFCAPKSALPNCNWKLQTYTRPKAHVRDASFGSVGVCIEFSSSMHIIMQPGYLYDNLSFSILRPGPQTKGPQSTRPSHSTKSRTLECTPSRCAPSGLQWLSSAWSRKAAEGFVVVPVPCFAFKLLKRVTRGLQGWPTARVSKLLTLAFHFDRGGKGGKKGDSTNAVMQARNDKRCTPSHLFE